MELKRIGVLSAGMVFGLMGAAGGLLTALIALVLTALTSSAWGDLLIQFTGLNFLFSLGGLIIMPLVNGVLGFISGAVGAALYNLIARLFGGLEVTFR